MTMARQPFPPPALRRRIRVPAWGGRGAGLTVGLAWALTAVIGCGLQAHPQSTPETSGSGGDSSDGSGGQNNGSGGQNNGSGGQNNGSGGINGDGSGGQSSGSGGRNDGSGGNSSSGSGGQSDGSGGQPSGSGGRVGGSGGGSGGQPSSSGGSTGSGGAGAGPGVTINGKFVPKDKAVVFLHFGHSNMRGQATKPSSLMSYFYNTEDGLWSYNGSFKLAKEPTAPEGTMSFAGPGMAILHSARAAVGSGSDVQFISVGFGRGSATTVDYAPTDAQSDYAPMIKSAKALKGNVTFGAIVVMLGITDGEHLPSNLVPAFPTRIAEIIQAIRNDLGEKDLPVMFCDYEQMASGTLAPTGSVGKVMQPLVRMLPGMVSKLALVPTDAIEMQDDHHFDMQGHKDWANRLVMLMQSNGWFPWK
jgi:hypothetical protein